MPYTTGNPVSIYYEVHGNRGSPLLMIAGFGASIADWLPEQIEQLSQKHQVIIFDNRGAGQSDKPANAYSMADFAADAVRVLDAIHVSQTHVFGVSMGGMIAQHVALNHRDRILSLILGCTTAIGDVNHPKMVAPSQEVLMELMRPPSRNRAQEIESGWKLQFTLPFIERNRELLERLRDNALAYPECPADARQLQLAAISSTHNTYDQLGSIQHPMLIQTGSEDLLIPAENSRIMARLMPGARFIEYASCGHRFVEENGEKVINDILTFLDEVDNTGQDNSE
jgi:pimeloyl-ACP methyl ester carboxylesterase